MGEMFDEGGSRLVGSKFVDEAPRRDSMDSGNTSGESEDLDLDFEEMDQNKGFVEFEQETPAKLSVEEQITIVQAIVLASDNTEFTKLMEFNDKGLKNTKTKKIEEQYANEVINPAIAAARNEVALQESVDLLKAFDMKIKPVQTTQYLNEKVAENKRNLAARTITKTVRAMAENKGKSEEELVAAVRAAVKKLPGLSMKDIAGKVRAQQSADARADLSKAAGEYFNAKGAQISAAVMRSPKVARRMAVNTGKNIAATAVAGGKLTYDYVLEPVAHKAMQAKRMAGRAAVATGKAAYAAADAVAHKAMQTGRGTARGTLGAVGMAEAGARMGVSSAAQAVRGLGNTVGVASAIVPAFATGVVGGAVGVATRLGQLAAGAVYRGQQAVRRGRHDMWKQYQLNNSKAEVAAINKVIESQISALNPSDQALYKDSMKGLEQLTGKSSVDISKSFEYNAKGETPSAEEKTAFERLKESRETALSSVPGLAGKVYNQEESAASKNVQAKEERIAQTKIDRAEVDKERAVERAQNAQDVTDRVVEATIYVADNVFSRMGGNLAKAANEVSSQQYNTAKERANEAGHRFAQRNEQERAEIEANGERPMLDGAIEMAQRVMGKGPKERLRDTAIREMGRQEAQENVVSAPPSTPKVNVANSLKNVGKKGSRGV